MLLLLSCTRDSRLTLMSSYLFWSKISLRLEWSRFSSKIKMTFSYIFWYLFRNIILLWRQLRIILIINPSCRRIIRFSKPIKKIMTRFRSLLSSRPLIHFIQFLNRVIISPLNSRLKVFFIVTQFKICFHWIWLF